MPAEMQNRRSEHRCRKDVGMHCSLLHGKATHLVTLRNFSRRGVYFESSGKFFSGNIIVLRTRADDEGFGAPRYAVGKDDPEVCTRFRSHVVAEVRRCDRLHGPDETPCYGVGAKIQILTD